MSGRRENWEIALAGEIEASRARRWEWGEHDCATFALRCVGVQASPEAAGAEEILAFLKDIPDVTDGLSARRALRMLEADDLGEVMDRLADRVPLLAAGRGDIAAVAADPGPAGPLALAVIEGGGLWVAAEPSGLLRLPLSAALAAWSTESLLCRQ